MNFVAVVVNCLSFYFSFWEELTLTLFWIYFCRETNSLFVCKIGHWCWFWYVSVIFLYVGFLSFLATLGAQSSSDPSWVWRERERLTCNGLHLNPTTTTGEGTRCRRLPWDRHSHTALSMQVGEDRHGHTNNFDFLMSDEPFQAKLELTRLDYSGCVVFIGWL